MSSAISGLEEQILTILRDAQGPITIPQIQEKLTQVEGIDTFDVRDAVWRLVAQRKAHFTPRRYVSSGQG
jgi:hypothetical protein